jgi:hypothetical protein
MDEIQTYIKMKQLFTRYCSFSHLNSCGRCSNCSTYVRANRGGNTTHELGIVVGTDCTMGSGNGSNSPAAECRKSGRSDSSTHPRGR